MLDKTIRNITVELSGVETSHTERSSSEELFENLSIKAGLTRKEIKETSRKFEGSIRRYEVDRITITTKLVTEVQEHLEVP